MNSRREQVWVGIFVIIAAVVLIGVVLSVSGAFAKEGVHHRAYFRFASGLAPGAPVRYGGLLAGKIEKLRVDPADSTRIEIELLVNPDIPVKTDSLAKITSLGALGESYLEVTTGTKDAPLAPPGSVLKSKEMVAISDLGDLIGGMVPTADGVLRSLNDRLGEMKVTIANVNDLLGETNRKNISASLVNVNGMLAESRPKVSATLTNVQTATEKLEPVMANVQAASDKMAPMLDDLKGTIKQANQALANIDSILVENRPDIKASLEQTRKMLNSISEVVDMVKNTIDRNTDNMDETLANVRAATDNIKELTDTLKRKPSVLIRGETGKDRQPGSTK
jgi:phospholipid/cholesterol/gamma-HCH transport system substrate-binding protein